MNLPLLKILKLLIKNTTPNHYRQVGYPRQDGRTQEQWRTILNQAYDTLKDPIKRKEHIETVETESSHGEKHINYSNRNI